MKKLILQPVISDENIVVQYTDSVALDKAAYITVPNGFRALAFIDEKVLFRIDPCVERPLIGYGRDLKGRRCRIAFVRTAAIPAMAWGFGNIQVNNARLNEAYRAGANGKYVIEIENIPKLISHFDSDRDITVEKLRDCTVPVIKNIGTAYLAKYFAGTDISVFEISAHTAELRARLFGALRGEEVFSSLGLKLKDLTVEGVHINEDDLALIRSRINKEHGENLPEQGKTCADDGERAESEVFLKKVEDELSAIRDEISRARTYAQPDIAEKLKDLRDELAADISSQIGDKMQEMQDSIADSIEEKFVELMPLREKAREEYFKNLKITAEVCIDRAENEDGLVPAAAIIYSNVEDNLINKFGVRHEGGKFVMGYGEYLKAAESLSAPDGTFVLKRYNREKRCYVLVPPVIINTGRDGGPQTVEMPPVIRFLNAGLNISAALQARDFWRFLNKIRHKAPESGAYLKDKFANFAQEKGYLVSALEFFKAHGLYTND